MLKPPPNQPAKAELIPPRITLRYQDVAIFKAEIRTDLNKFHYNTVVNDGKGLVNQVIVFTAKDPSDMIEITGEITGSKESFPCESDRRPEGFDIVRHSYGLSHSLLNRAVYDRKWDWVLSVDHYADVIIEPAKSTSESHTFKIEIRGGEIIIRFRPRFYQKHRGLGFFEPWTYRVWKEPVVGWCSWFAYRSDVTEENVRYAADVISKVLLPYGYEYLQIDAGYESGDGLPESWLNPNWKFPSGLRNLAEYIRNKGLKPGIWTNVAFSQKEYADSHKDFFVIDENGDIATGNWIHISMDGSNPETLNTLVRPVYRGLREMGWEYFKVDALRHLRYEGYNSNINYFRKRKVDRVDAYRELVRAIREEIGREYFVLGCWGARPELIGIIDGCRLGTDGYSFAGLSQFNSFNNIVWLNDPDHIELTREEAYRSTMVASLTGSLFLLTDKPEKYFTDIVEPAKRTAPVLFTLPGQLYDVDPSRSENLSRVDSEVSGSGPRIFDAGLTPKCHLYLLEINKPFENWVVLGRTGGSFDSIRFKELGLLPYKEYFVFEFWSERLLGSFTGEFCPGEIDPQYNCQLFCIKERKRHPQVIATNRHITCGGYELSSVEWESDILRGKNRVVGGDTYKIFITESEGHVFDSFSCNGAEVLDEAKKGMLRIVSVKSETDREVRWFARFAAADAPAE